MDMHICDTIIDEYNHAPTHMQDRTGPHATQPQIVQMLT